MSSTSDKGKGKSRLVESFSNERGPSSSSSNATSKPTTPVRHGRGPLINDDSDDETGRLLINIPDDEDEDERRVLRSNGKNGLANARARPSRTYHEIICYCMGIIIFLMLFVVAVVHLWLGHLISEQSNQDLQQLATRGLILEGPQGVKIIESNDSSSVFIVEMDFMAGFDVKKGLNWQQKEQSKNWFRNAENRLASYVTGRIGHVSIDLNEVAIRETYKIEQSSEAILLAIRDLSTIKIPLSYPTKSNAGEVRLDRIRLRLPISLPDTDELVKVAKKIWDKKQYDLEVDLSQVQVIPGGTISKDLVGVIVRKIKGVTVPNLAKQFMGTIPDIPGASDPASLVDLISYDIYEKKEAHSTIIALSARASIKNPFLEIKDLPSFDYAMPFNLPVSIYLPSPPSTIPPPQSNSDEIVDGTLVAKVETRPFSFKANQERAEIVISGQLIKAGDLTRDDGHGNEGLSAALSRFMARYLAGKKNEILVKYDQTVETQDGGNYPPRIVGDLVKDVTVPLEFPGSKEKMQLFKNLRIEDMKIKLSGMLKPSLDGFWTNDDGGDDEPEGDLLCSGRVVGEIDLPKQFKKLERALNVNGIWPDVYVYDGDLPRGLAESLLRKRNQILFNNIEDESRIIQDDEVAVLTSRYPPHPTPANAFARLHPASLIPATTTHSPANSTHEATTYISATFIDAPLFLLPGRGDVFRRFVSKILFGGPGAKAKAGVRGVSAAKVGLGGWGAIAIEGLPVEGEFWVGSGSGSVTERFGAEE